MEKKNNRKQIIPSQNMHHNGELLLDLFHSLFRMQNAPWRRCVCASARAQRFTSEFSIKTHEGIKSADRTKIPVKVEDKNAVNITWTPHKFCSCFRSLRSATKHKRIHFNVGNCINASNCYFGALNWMRAALAPGTDRNTNKPKLIFTFVRIGKITGKLFHSPRPLLFNNDSIGNFGNDFARTCRTERKKKKSITTFDTTIDSVFIASNDRKTMYVIV